MHEESDVIAGTSSLKMPRERTLERSGLLEVSGRQALDRLIALVRDVMDVPVAFISLCQDDRQLFIAHRGLPASHADGWPLARTLCRHVIARGAALAVADVATDPAFNTSAAETGLAIGAYLGIPVRVGGAVAGVLAVADWQPRLWSEGARRRLGDFARIVGDEIDARFSETRWRVLFEDTQESFYVAEAIRDYGGRMVDFRYIEVNPAFERLPGRAGAAGRTVRELLPAQADKLVEDYRTVVESSEPRFSETETDGEWYEVRARGLGDDRFAVTFHSIGERRRQEALAAQANRRYRMLFDSIDEGFFLIDVIFEGTQAVDYRFVEVNAAFTRHTGLCSVVGKRMRALLPGHEDHWYETYGRVAKTGEALRFRNIAASLGNRWYESYAFRVDGEAPNRVAVLFNDVTERVAAETRRQVLNSELAHRLKNTLAIVSSIISQTLRSASDMETARQSLSNRIQALSKAHDVLLSGQRDAASVAAIVEGVVAIHDGSGRVRLNGPHLPIGPKASLSLSLIVHELATNAGKYGALSAPEGVVDVEWGIAIPEGTNIPCLAFAWAERGGPPVGQPPRKGFGTRLVEMGLSGSDGASVVLDYARDGFHCRLTAPLAEIATADEAEAG
ncbi:HWE histidine kinase domain-containing protein [Aureimonas psammosilenae]|uniref:HWE histidine kinase domain-containing protein n=1 Tax=Aureimonas psammosilenae TaxID=2495496 RepID=UPI001260E68D|nr:HWE histidine kinase domain-containing protein [Aureimonas psammosilenae]